MLQKQSFVTVTVQSRDRLRLIAPIAGVHPAQIQIYSSRRSAGLSTQSDWTKNVVSRTTWMDLSYTTPKDHILERQWKLAELNRSMADLKVYIEWEATITS